MTKLIPKNQKGKPINKKDAVTLLTYDALLPRPNEGLIGVPFRFATNFIALKTVMPLASERSVLVPKVVSKASDMIKKYFENQWDFTDSQTIQTITKEKTPKEKTPKELYYEKYFIIPNDSVNSK